MRDVVNAAGATNEWGKLVVAERRARILSSQTMTIDYHMRDEFSALSIKSEVFVCLFLGRTKARAMDDSFRKKMRGKCKEIRGNNEFYTQGVTWELAATPLRNASDALNALRTGHHVKTKCISTSSPRHPHKEESLVRTSKHVPAHHLILGKRTRTGLDSNRKTHEQSRSSHRQFVRCTWGESLLVRKRGCFGR